MCARPAGRLRAPQLVRDPRRHPCRPCQRHSRTARGRAAGWIRAGAAPGGRGRRDHGPRPAACVQVSSSTSRHRALRHAATPAARHARGAAQAGLGEQTPERTRACVRKSGRQAMRSAWREAQGEGRVDDHVGGRLAGRSPCPHRQAAARIRSRRRAAKGARPDDARRVGCARQRSPEQGAMPACLPHEPCTGAGSAVRPLRCPSSGTSGRRCARARSGGRGQPRQPPARPAASWPRACTGRRSRCLSVCCCRL